jgi:hypothetical protein
VISDAEWNAEHQNQSFNLNLSLLSGKTRSKSVISMAHEMQEHRFGEIIFGYPLLAELGENAFTFLSPPQRVPSPVRLSAIMARVWDEAAGEEHDSRHG